MSLEGAIAAHRFGLGARPGEIDRASRDPEGVAHVPDQRAGRAAGAAGRRHVQEQRRSGRRNVPVPARPGDGDAQRHRRQIRSRRSSRSRRRNSSTNSRRAYALGFTTDRPFAERLVWFWSNHFVVSAQNPRAINVRRRLRARSDPPAHHRQVRGHAAGGRQPSGDAALSRQCAIDRSELGRRQDVGKGLNENLGRELMELYTLGVDGGYTQADVIALAKILTGWTLSTNGENNGFSYYAESPRAGRCHLARPDLSADVRRAASRRSAIWRMIPPPRATSRARSPCISSPTIRRRSRSRGWRRSFKETGGDLRALAHAVVDDPAAWTPRPGKRCARRSNM